MIHGANGLSAKTPSAMRVGWTFMRMRRIQWSELTCLCFQVDKARLSEQSVMEEFLYLSNQIVLLKYQWLHEEAVQQYAMGSVWKQENIL